MNEKGVFIVIEGTDGSGKGTQFNILSERLTSAGYDVATFDFPRYDEPSSYFVKEYLNGRYGTSEEVGPYTGSLFYALDRYQAAPEIRQAQTSGKIVLANRFTGSNMAHQGTKFDFPEQRRGYYIWLDNLEYEMLGIPRPSKSLVLRVPAETAQKLVDNKEPREYTEKKRDIHEADLNHLKRSVEVYDEICQLFPKDFQRLDCVRSGKLMDIEAVSEVVWRTVQPLLPPPQKEKGYAESIAIAEKLNNPFVSKKGNEYVISEKGEKFLDEVVTNTKSNVYAFTDKISPVTVAAAMARLSRRGDDMRVTLLDEFAQLAGKDQKLLQRVITAYGDDSVQQLVGQHFVVEGASNLLTKKLEWGRLAAYLEQSTRYIYFDKKNEQGKYKYYTPEHFDQKTKVIFEDSMNKIFELYSSMVSSLAEYVRSNSDTPQSERDSAWQGATRAQACDAIRPVLPVATQSTVGVFASGQALESLIMHLLSDELPESITTGQKILEECRKIIPTFLERADRPDRGGALVAYRANTKKAVKVLSEKYLDDNYGQYDTPVKLTKVWPRNELDLVPDILYEHSNLSLEEINVQVSAWPYSKKEAILLAYIGERLNRRHKPGRALENAHYSWDLMCDYGIFRDLQRHRMVDDLEWQILTPRYGYDVPELVDESGLTEQFQECFDISLELHSKLQGAGYDLEAQYATLLGHKMRWKMTFNAREAFHFIELRTSPQGHPGYRKLTQQMYEKVSEVHPLLGDAMKFVNKDEDPKLSRLAAERYTQFKLKQMGKK